MTLRFLIPILLALAPAAFSQNTPAPRILYVTADPSGACSVAAALRYNTTNGNFWGCDNGTWATINGGGGGSMTWPSTPGIGVCTGTPCTAWGTSLTAPTGALVGTTDTQTLTNKTVDGVTPTVFAFLDPTSSVQTQLNTKAPLASPTFTGTPAAPTPSQADNSTKLATTAYVDILGATKAASNAATTVNGQTCTLGLTCTIALSAINPQTATYQVLAADFSNYKTITAASGTFTVTLVASGSQPANGQYITVINYGSGVVTIARSGQNINGGAGSITLAAASATAPTSAKVYSDGANYFATTAGGASGSGGYGYATGTTSAKPACGGTYSGRWYVATDSPLAYGCNGTTDQAYYGNIGVTPPGAIAGYTSAGTGTITQVGDAVSFRNNGSATVAILFSGTAINTSSSIVTAQFDSLVLTNQYSVCGVWIYDTTSTSIAFGLSLTTSGQIAIGTNVQGGANTYTALGQYTGPIRVRLRYTSSTNVVPEMSTDLGATWFTPQGISAVNPTALTQKKLAVGCGNIGGNASVSSGLLTHATFQ